MATGTAKVKCHFGLAGTGKVKFTLKKGTQDRQDGHRHAEEGHRHGTRSRTVNKGKYSITASYR